MGGRLKAMKGGKGHKGKKNMNSWAKAGGGKRQQVGGSWDCPGENGCDIVRKKKCERGT